MSLTGGHICERSRDLTQNTCPWLVGWGLTDAQHSAMQQQGVFADNFGPVSSACSQGEAAAVQIYHQRAEHATVLLLPTREHWCLCHAALLHAQTLGRRHHITFVWWLQNFNIIFQMWNRIITLSLFWRAEWKNKCYIWVKVKRK